MCHMVLVSWATLQLACEQALPLKGMVTSLLTSYQALQQKSLLAGYFTVSFSRLYALTSEINVAVAIC